MGDQLLHIDNQIDHMMMQAAFYLFHFLQLFIKYLPTVSYLQDILTNKESRMYIRKNFCAFIRYLEELDPELTNITSYMRKLDTFLFRILSVRITLLPFPIQRQCPHLFPVFWILCFFMLIMTNAFYFSDGFIIN